MEQNPQSPRDTQHINGVSPNGKETSHINGEHMNGDTANATSLKLNGNDHVTKTEIVSKCCLASIVMITACDHCSSSTCYFAVVEPDSKSQHKQAALTPGSPEPFSSENVAEVA